MMNRHLASKWDVADDGSLLKKELCPDPSAKRNCCKRKAPNDQDGGCLTWNALCKGRLPPSVSVSSGDILALMGHHAGSDFTTSSSGVPHASSESLPSYSSKLHSGSRLA